MPSDFSGTPGAGPAAVTSDEGNGTTTPTSPLPAASGRLEELITGFRAELVDMRREFRNRLAPKAGEAVTAPTTPTAPPAASTWDPMAVLAFRDAVDEAGVSVTVAQRRMLEKLYRAESGVADPVSWVREQADVLGWRKPTGTTAPAPVTPPAPVKVPETPAPTGTGAGNAEMPDDPMLLPQSVIDRMTPEEIRERWDRWKQRSGVFRHPYANAREKEKLSGADLANAAAALRQVLAGKK